MRHCTSLCCLQVGGVDQLLELVETGVGITEHKTRSYPLAIYYGEDDLPEVAIDAVCCNVLSMSCLEPPCLCSASRL